MNKQQINNKVNSNLNRKKGYKNYKFSNLLIAGLLGTLSFYIAAYVDMVVTGVPLDITVVLGQLVAGDHESAQIIGHIIHISNGLGLTLFFGYIFLPISTRIMKNRIWLHGIIFGIIVTVTTVWFGLLPALGAGIAGLNIAPEIPAMTLFRHIVFGVVLGVVLGLVVRNKTN